MRRIAHIINPVIVDHTSDLFIAQPVTFESMRIAKEKANGFVDVALFSGQFEEDAPLVPSFLTKTPNLQRSVLDYGRFRKTKKLPLIKDILDGLYQSTDAEYLVYTNVDIALQPTFYLEVNRFIDKGYDAFIINRRTISSLYKRVEELPFMYNEVGEKHPGFDCFIFRRTLYPSFKLEKVVIGANRIGLTLATNLISYAQRARIFEDLHLTFHIGEERAWRTGIYDDYSHYNLNEYASISKAINQDIGTWTRYRRHYKALSLRQFVQLFKYL